MKKTAGYILLLGAAILLLQSCRKYDYYADTAVPVDNTGGVTALFSALRSTPQSFAVTAGKTQTIYGTAGTKITFYPNSFKDHNGRVVSGTVSITLIEIYTTGQMIANRATTCADSKTLGSGGEVMIKATMNGQELQANRYGIGFKQVMPSKQPMALFYGNTSNTDSLVNWEISSPGIGAAVGGTTDSVSDSSVVVVIGGGSSADTISILRQPANYYQFDSCIHFGWINCDYFYSSSSQLYNVSLVMPDTGYRASNTEVFMIFPTLKSVTHLGNYVYNTHTFSLTSGNYLPANLPIFLVAIAKRNGQYYYYENKDITGTANISINAAMQAMSLADVQAKLSGL